MFLYPFLIASAIMHCVYAGTKTLKNCVHFNTVQFPIHVQEFFLVIIFESGKCYIT